MIDNKYAEIQKKREKNEEVSGFLPFLIDANLSRNEIYGNIAEIMLGAVDTVSTLRKLYAYSIELGYNVLNESVKFDTVIIIGIITVVIIIANIIIVSISIALLLTHV